MRSWITSVLQTAPVQLQYCDMYKRLQETDRSEFDNNKSIYYSRFGIFFLLATQKCASRNF